MNRLEDTNVLELAKEIAVQQGLVNFKKADSLIGEKKISCQKISSDGSTRRFWRILDKGESICVIVAPDKMDKQGLAEATAAWEIGRHLEKKHIPVPVIYGIEKNSGILLFEDLGDVRLHGVWTEKVSTGNSKNKEDLFRQVIEDLVRMQFDGFEDFDPSWCWDTPVYDYSLMVEREAKYFLDAFWQGLLGQPDNTNVLIELQDLASQAEKAPRGYFLHRDFQSRNIMIKDGNPFLIDFQGARSGPLGYDLASLLIDPYIHLSDQEQDRLMSQYLDCACKYQQIDRNSFLRHYTFLAMQRNLQIVGAFAFLYKVRGKVFFRNFLQPALISMRNRLDTPCLHIYKNLRILIDESMQLVKKVL